MAKNKIRQVFNLVGLDVHTYRKSLPPLSWLTKLSIKEIIDVGANTGQFAKEIREVLTDAKIYSFEPLKECFDKLNETMQNDQNFKSFHCALGDKNEKTTINKSSYSLSSSLLEMSDIHKKAFPHTRDSIPETIEVRKMNDVFRNENLDREILIKIDTQGYEDKVIQGGTETISKAKILIVETSFVTLYKDQVLFDGIYEILKKLGFSYRGSLHQKLDPKTGEILFEDSIFAK